MAIRFSVEELRARRGRICTELENRGLYALRCYRQKTDFYLAGYDIFGYCFFAVSAVLRRWPNGFFTRAPERMAVSD